MPKPRRAARGQSAARRRTPIPKEVATRVRFDADDTCCRCQRRARRVQIHHLDADPSNHAIENLIVLCVECHDRAELRGGVGRALDADLLRTYRDDWLRTVELRRARKRRSGHRQVALRVPAQEPTAEDRMDVAAAVEVRRIGYAAEDAVPDWDQVAREIKDLARFARDFRSVTKIEVLSVAHHLACEARQGMPPRLAWMLFRVVSEALPLVFPRKPVNWAVEGPEHVRVAMAAEIGRSLVYDGARYLKDLGVVKAGSAILADALRSTASVVTPQIRRDVEGAFDERIAAASEHKEHDVERWLRFERAEAQEQGSGDYESVKDLMDAK